MVSYPAHFMSALGLVGDRLEQLSAYDRKHRDFLRRLPSDVQDQIAFRSAWSLLFGEAFA